jgi:exopolysaccharide biosynthesis polyprenyl glycosylphosphotransferase
VTQRVTTHEVRGDATRVTRLQSIELFVGGCALVVFGILSAVLEVTVASSWLTLAIALCTWMISGHAGLFQVAISIQDWQVMPTVLSSTTVSVGAIALMQTTVIGDLQSSRDYLLASSTTLVSMALGVGLGRGIVRRLWKSGRFRTTAIVVGSGVVTHELIIELSLHRELGIDVVNELDLRDSPGDLDGTTAVSQLAHATQTMRPDRVIIGDSSTVDDLELVRALRATGSHRSRVYVLPRLFEMGVGNSLFSSDQLRGFPLLRVNRPEHPRLSLAIKRGFDIVVSFAGLVLVAPVLAVAALLVKSSSPGPVFFWQERVGQHNRPIQLAKLRSMTISGASDKEWTAEARVTSVGRILRRTAIDELPQLWSVLVGDMSLVGPRPERPIFVEQFSQILPSYDDRHRMKVGLTGLSQIAGLRGDTSISERAKYDNMYIDQWTFSGDILILVRTVFAIVRERAYAANHEALAAAIGDDVVLTRIDLAGDDSAVVQPHKAATQ